MTISGMVAMVTIEFLEIYIDIGQKEMGMKKLKFEVVCTIGCWV